MDFISFANAHGLVIKNLVSGRIARCATRSHKSRRNGAFFFAGSWGWVMDWASDSGINVWKEKGLNDSPELKKQIKDSQKKYSQDRAKLNYEAAKKAEAILGQCTQDLSPYLIKKGFTDMCSNILIENDMPVLVVPMHKNNCLIGCQKIYPDGEKKFLYGQVLNDACFVIGNGKRTFFVEGYVSGLSLQRILQALKVSHRIYVCFSANNLLRFAKRIDGFVVADNDESGTGERVAIESGRYWWMPPVVGQDINDYHLDVGIFRASQELKKHIYSRAVG